MIARQSIEIVRKELKDDDKHNITNEEHRVLSYLNCLAHPNIVELIGSYSYKGVQNLLFPRVGVSLERAFTGEQREQRLDQDDWLIALSGLSSAIERVHNCSSDAPEFHLIGCHHDLKPNNILVHNGKLILADFGLSRLKRGSQTSKTDFKMGSSYYEAPECAEYDQEFKKGTVSRPSDIWSFGCIIAELLTFMLKGTKGLKNFKETRKAKLGGFYIAYYFHSGIAPNAGVDEWLTELQSGASLVNQKLIDLIRRMLSMDPSLRPKASVVTFELRRLAAQAMATLVNLSWDAHGELVQIIEVSVERERFRCLMWAMGILHDMGHDSDLTGGDCSWIDKCFEQVIQALRDIRKELNSVSSEGVVERVYSFKLRMLNDDISRNLPQELLNRVTTLVELIMMGSKDPGILTQRSAILPDDGAYSSLRALAAIKELRDSGSSALESAASPPLLNSKWIRSVTSCRVHHLAWVTNSPEEDQRLVFIEWVLYDYRWLQPSRAKDMLDRMRARARVLSSTDVQSRLRTLRRSGYFQDEPRRRFGFIFDYPSVYNEYTDGDGLGSQAAHTVVEQLGDKLLHSLNATIQTINDISMQPCLEDRFGLAATLASSLLEFHKVGWLNKNLSSHNIVFAKSTMTMEQIYNIRSPYFIGLNHSRPGDPDDRNTPELSEGPDSRNLNGYCHPDYLLDVPRYRFHHDYFSLGIIPLEIGLWKRQIELGGFSILEGAPTASRDYNTKERVTFLLKEWVPQLASSMRTGYYNVVKVCLNGDFRTSGSHAVLLSFDEKVVSQLKRWANTFLS